MFGSSERPNPLDPIIRKATDETLTADNWEYILDACDQVSCDPENGSHNAILSIEKRLKIKDGNVLLRTLSLITALAENCGSKMKQEIATTRFVNVLMSLINDNTIHQQIKIKIIEMIDQLSQSFAKDPSLRIISDTYTDLKHSRPDLINQAGVGGTQPAKPLKHEITDMDRLKEEEELNMALKLSLQEYEQHKTWRNPGSLPQGVEDAAQSSRHPYSSAATINNNNNSVNNNNNNNNNNNAEPVQQQQAQQQQQQNVPISETKNSGSNIATVSRVRALYDLVSYEPDELSFRKGDVITVIESVYRDWWRGSLRGQIGIFPLNYVTPLKEPTMEELVEELRKEQEILDKSTQIEKLLSLLSNFQSRLLANKISSDELNSLLENQQIFKIYNDVVMLRPKLGNLIEKYSSKKDDLILLNEKLVNSERIYNDLMDVSVDRYKTNNDNNGISGISGISNNNRTTYPPAPYPTNNGTAANGAAPYPKNNNTNNVPGPAQTPIAQHQQVYPNQQPARTSASALQLPDTNIDRNRHSQGSIQNVAVNQRTVSVPQSFKQQQHSSFPGSIQGAPQNVSQYQPPQQQTVQYASNSPHQASIHTFQQQQQQQPPRQSYASPRISSAPTGIPQQQQQQQQPQPQQAQASPQMVYPGQVPSPVQQQFPGPPSHQSSFNGGYPPVGNTRLQSQAQQPQRQPPQMQAQAQAQAQIPHPAYGSGY
ncbi:hypothetical protein PACTADRAFT_81571 [Pachysolen tannophilus NRRL Y-2460]|uniref:Class E vacuolar protein-sorting machinery protein HSE1 n=1 Tax=Pachysolen tannophilus NRRL Y-2460 TaxID=669874 RepID=A0A1E4TTG3_PACTA|nr:hypothetical protein PACTADRAFT_81571 [Pachysolen tannophilus NRRL Y-2460]